MVDEWTYTDEQLALLEGVKDKAKANGLWNFFLPDSDVGGLSNLDYAYIATELGKERLASECLNCAAPIQGTWKFWSGWVPQSRKSSGSSHFSAARSVLRSA